VATSASPRQQSSQAKSAAPSQTRSAILPIGLATAGLAGLLIWLGSGGDELPSTTSEPPANVAPARPDTPGTPEIRALAPEAQPTAAAPALAAAPVDATDASATPSASAAASAAEPSAAAPSAAEPSAAAPSALASAAEPSAVPATPTAPSRAEAGAEAPPPGSTPSTAEPFASDEGLTAGPITTVYMAPDCAELYRRGKRVGRSGVRVMIPEGKKRTFEVVCPGHGTRKLTLDGSRTEVMVGLRPKK
jgi:hypothetical protein